MKKNNNAKIVIFILSIMFSFISCNLFIDKSEKVESIGYLNLNLSSSNNQRTVSPQLDVTSYNIIFSNGPVSRESITTTNSEQVIPLHTGSWDIHVDALNGAGDIVESGDLTDILISIDSTLNETILLSPTAVGTGSVDLVISWTDGIGITGYDVTLDGTTIGSEHYTESVDTGITNLRYNQDLGSGSYTFLLVLKKGDLILGNIYEVINVYDNLTSSKVITLSESDFTQLPYDPDNLVANEGLGCIHVTWNDNSYVETGYIIERRVEGDVDFTILDANLLYNTNSYIDYDIIQDITYEYRVKAFNTIGESGYSSIDSSSLIIPDVTGLVSDETPTQAKTFNWESSDDTATFRYIINSETTAPEDWSGASWTASTTTTVDTDSGTFYLHVQSKDTAGNISDAITVSFMLDNTCPEILDLVSDPSAVQSYTWNWSSDDVNAQFKYLITDSIDEPGDWSGVEWSETNTATIDSGDGLFYIHVIAKDILGNVSSVQTASISLDNTAPSIPIVTGVTPTNSLNPLWDWNDIEGASQYRCGYTEGNWVVSGLELSEFTPVESLTEGSHTLYVQAGDNAGNWSSSGQFIIEIDTTLPDIPVVTGPTPTNDTTPEWSWSEVEGAVAYRYGYSEDSWITESSIDLFYIPDTSLEDGDHNLYVQSKDEAGNWSTSGYKLVTIDTIAPEAPVVSAVTPTSNTTPTWTWTLADDVVEIQYEEYNNPGYWVVADNSTLSFTSSELTDGNYNLYVQGRDLAGNWSDPGEFVISVDTTAPYVGFMDESVWVNSSINMNPEYTDANDLTFLWEEVGSTGYVSFDDVTDPYTSVSGLDGEEGTYQLRLTATDVLGYSNSAIFNFMWDKKGPTPGNSGTISTSVVSASSVSLNWSEALDLSSDNTWVSYKVIGSTLDNISTIEEAEIHGDGRFVVNETLNGVYSTTASGLETGETYYFNIITSDELGNKSIYNTVSQSLTGSAGITISTNRPWEESITFNKANGEVVSQTGSYSVSVNETFDSYSWELSGMDLSSETNSSISIDCSTLNPGIHTLFSITGKNGELFSNSINFVVEN